MTAALHLLHCRPDDRLLISWGASRHLIPRRGDLGYALHGAWQAALGPRAPQPFRYFGGEKGLLAYTASSASDLREAIALGDSGAIAALGLAATATHGGFSMRRMPMSWPSGRRLRFEVRVRPVIREGKTGRERDAFLHAAGSVPPGTLERESVYAQWLRAQLQPVSDGTQQAWHGAVRLEAVHLSEFHLSSVTRMGARPAADGRRPRSDVVGPDAVLTGTLVVENPIAFQHWLARGIGRHRAFGYGMVLLKPAN
jgi:CRISPR system Cascade subunit CasE